MARNNDSEVVERVLVTRFSAIGDVAMTIPALYDACAANPATEFVMLTRRGLDAIFLSKPANLRVEGVDLQQYKGVWGMWRLLRDVQRRYGRFDCMVDLHDVIRTRLLRIFARLRGIIAVRIDKGRYAKKQAVRRGGRGGVRLALSSQQTRYRATFVEAGLPCPEHFNGLPHKELANLPSGINIGIAPFAAHQGKIYPTELMEQVVAGLVERGAHVWLFGGKGREQTICRGWAEKYGPTVHSLAGEGRGFAGEMELMAHLDAMLSMDSANMHLAALMGTRVVSIWGATHPCCGFAPWGQDPDDMVQLNEVVCRPCSVYGNKPCAHGDYRCLSKIAPQTIIDKLLTTN